VTEILDRPVPEDAAVIVGAGLAGLFLALKMAPRRALVVAPTPLGAGSASAWAQGGLAAALAALLALRPSAQVLLANEQRSALDDLLSTLRRRDASPALAALSRSLVDVPGVPGSWLEVSPGFVCAARCLVGGDGAARERLSASS
jgi:glycine/D-amino acid oxidase-like deaminating enzyme